MPHVTSADGTRIGYDQLSDEGPAVVLVGGGLDDGTENLPLGEHLAATFAVIAYRRRGRGDSGDTQPYAVQREIEDLAAVIDATGGRAHLFGPSLRRGTRVGGGCGRTACRQDRRPRDPLPARRTR